MSEVKAAPEAAVKTEAVVPVVPAAPSLPYGQRLYEVMWVVDASAAREGYTKILAGLKELVEKSGGTWVNADRWDERRLAYPIKKKKRGLYIISHFSAPTGIIVRLERNIQISDLVLRALVTRDEDGLITTPPVRGIDDDDFGGGFGGGGGGGGERRFFGGGGGDRGGDRGQRKGGRSRD